MPICLRLLTHCILNRGQEQGDEHADDRDDHQQLDEREAGGARTRGAEGAGIVHDLSLRSPITRSRRVTHARAFEHARLNRGCWIGNTCRVWRRL